MKQPVGDFKGIERWQVITARPIREVGEGKEIGGEKERERGRRERGGKGEKDRREIGGERERER